MLALCRWVLLETLWLQSWGLQLEQMQETFLVLCTVEANRSIIAALEYITHEFVASGSANRNGMRRFLA